jgi:enoyl-CoA hydratase
MVMGCMRNNDFKEGVRALLISKDGNPSWNPASLSEVTKEYVDSYFASLGEYELNLRNK